MRDFWQRINLLVYSIYFPVLLFQTLMFSSHVQCSSELRKMSKSDEPDLSDITWAHAVNNRDQLDKVLAGSLDFIEADVSLGHLTKEQYGDVIPIMAHPPYEVSDISLKEWLEIVIHRDTGKGIKLDFKSIEVVKPSLLILEEYSAKMNFSLWLNADILSGPIDSTWQPVDGYKFLSLCQKYFPEAVLSIGWTTEWQPTFPQKTWHYEWQQVRKMADIIRCFGYENYFPSFTFPVRAIFASRSIKQLQWLLGVTPGSSITIWNGARDPLGIKDLIRIRKSFPKNKAYYDVPHPSYKSFMKIKNNKNVSYEIDSYSGFTADQWRILTRGLGPDCSSYTYVGNTTIAFGKSLETAVLLKKLLVVDDKHALNIHGRIEFCKDYESKTSSVFNNKITIVIIDISLLSKSVTGDGVESLDLTGSDSDILWSAVNASHLYTFDPEHSCHLFKVNTNSDRSFQAWTVPCDDMNNQKSFEETIMNAVQEVPSTKRLVLPKGQFLIGFLSNGNEHAVIWDLYINEDFDKKSHNASSMIEISLGIFSLLFFYFVSRRLIN